MQRRSEVLPIAKKLNKFVTLPSISNWRVDERDVLVSGKVVSLFRTKRFLLPDDLSILTARHTTVTRHGFLVVYEEEKLGLIIDLRAASHILTITDKFKGRRTVYRRSHIKIRLARGNAHLFVRDADVQKWISAIIVAHTRNSPPIVKSVAQQTLPVEDIVEVPKANIELANSPSTSTNSGLITVIENDAAAGVGPSVVPSVRKGPMSVSTLRRRLEKKLLMKTPKESEDDSLKTAISDMPQFVTSLVVIPSVNDASKENVFVANLEPEEASVTQEEREEEAKEEEKILKKEWWTRSLRC